MAHQFSRYQDWAQLKFDGKERVPDHLKKMQNKGGLEERDGNPTQHRSFFPGKTVAAAVAALSAVSTTDSWIVDYGCSDHMCNDLDIMEHLQPCDPVTEEEALVNLIIFDQNHVMPFNSLMTKMAS